MEDCSAAKPPTSKPTQGVQFPNTSPIDKLKTIELKAPITMIPSSPTLTIPLRSENVPPNAVKINGAA